MLMLSVVLVVVLVVPVLVPVVEAVELLKVGEEVDAVAELVPVIVRLVKLEVAVENRSSPFHGRCR